MKLRLKLNHILELGNENVFQLLVLRMILIIPILKGDFFLYLTPFVVIGLLFSALLKNVLYWVVTTVVFLLYIYNKDLTKIINNHDYVLWLIYLMATITVYLSSSKLNWRPYLSFTSHSILALVFLYAFLGKITSKEFKSGEFFEFVLSTDVRFANLTTFFSSSNFVRENRDQFEQFLLTENPENAGVKLMRNDNVTNLAKYMSYWTLAVEFLIGILFLACKNKRMLFAGHILLLIFILCTYPITPVLGFAQVLLILGFITSYLKFGNNHSITLAYLFLFIASSFFNFPFVRVLGLL